jgi:hypothetical protein
MARERAHATSKRGRDARQGAHEGGRSKTGCGIYGGFARGSVTTAGFINEGADSSGQWAAWMSDRRCWGERQDSEWDQCTRPGDPCANVSTLGARPMAQSACGSHVQRANAPTHQRTRPPLRHHPTAHLCDRLTLVCGACPLHTRRRCPLRWLPHRRPVHRTPTQGHRQTPQTNTSHKHRSPVLAHGLGCRMRARHLHRASGLPHRRAHAQGPMAAPAPLHPGPVPCGRSLPLPYTALHCTALYRPVSPLIALDRP